MPELTWNEKEGYGFLRTDDPRTDFFGEYLQKTDTPMGIKLIEFRLALVRMYLRDDELMTDVGIGDGSFCLARGVNHTHGADVDPIGVSWLEKTGILEQPGAPTHLSFWDSFEHIGNHAKWLSGVPKRGLIFMSIPIFESKEDALASKHYKPGEHLWYFTHWGLIQYMEERNFFIESHSRMEELLGREGIETYVFYRIA